jgi:hypothetical protein
MNTVSIELPPIDAEKSVEVEVRVNGKKSLLSYRLEVFQWREWCRPEEQRVECLKRMIQSYDRQWQLMHIGTPTEQMVPIMFRRVSQPVGEGA